MKIVPLAADSLGVRSMATYVEAGRTGFLIDPGATLAPSRYGLPPADSEWDALRRANDRISAYATRSSVVFVSHYHEDHFRSEPTTYAGRRVLLKDPRRMVAGQQLRRASELAATLAPHARVEPADGLEQTDPEFELRVSPPLPHGLEGTTLGYVLALTIVDPRDRSRFVFASDVQGPLSPVAAAWLIQQRPTLLYLAGPPSYIEHEVGTPVVERGIDHLLRVMDSTGCRVIMDHHAVRDGRFLDRFARLWQTGRVVTAAGYLGVPEAPLESRRHSLWASARKPGAKAPRPDRWVKGADAPLTLPRRRRWARGGQAE
jgi:uncharacterized protein